MCYFNFYLLFVTTYTTIQACSSASKSEIVVPLIFEKNESKSVLGVLDVDSEFLNNFDSIDEIYLNKICDLLVENYEKFNWTIKQKFGT